MKEIWVEAGVSPISFGNWIARSASNTMPTIT